MRTLPSINEVRGTTERNNTFSHVDFRNIIEVTEQEAIEGFHIYAENKDPNYSSFQVYAGCSEHEIKLLRKTIVDVYIKINSNNHQKIIVKP